MSETKRSGTQKVTRVTVGYMIAKGLDSRQRVVARGGAESTKRMCAMDKETEDEMERRLRETFDKRVPEGWFDWRGLQTNGTFFEQSSAPSSPFNSLFVDETQKQNCVEHLCTKEGRPCTAAASSERGERSESAEKGETDAKVKSEEEEEEDDEEEEESESEESEDNFDGEEREDFRQKVLNNQRHRQLQLLRQGDGDTPEGDGDTPEGDGDTHEDDGGAPERSS